jgi:hypothetical protein
MGALAQLSASAVDVEPGRVATITVTVRNTGTVVDRFSFEALGDSAAWVRFDPPMVSLFPNASGTTNVVLSPPRDPSARAGAVTLGVRVVSAEDSAGSVVEEATVNVAAFSNLTVGLEPRVVTGRIMGRAQLAVDNRSNCQYRAVVSGRDPQTALTFKCRPLSVDVGPGEAAFVRVSIRPGRRIWRGPPRTQPYQLALQDETVDVLRGAAVVGVAGAGPDGRVQGDGDGALTKTAEVAAISGKAPAATPTGRPAEGVAGQAPAAQSRLTTGAGAPSPHPNELTADGSMLQEPILPSWFLKALAAVVALLALLILLWYTLFKPQIRSTAQDEVNKQVPAAVNKQVPAAVNKQVPAAINQQVPAAVTRQLVSHGVIPPGSTGPLSNMNGGGQAAGNNTTTVVYTVPPKHSLQITDLLVENSAGDSGNLALAKNGVPVIQWAMADFRDLDYHWITPTVFGPGSQVQLTVSGCSGHCNPGIYYAGHLVSG